MNAIKFFFISLLLFSCQQDFSVTTVTIPKEKAAVDKQMPKLAPAKKSNSPWIKWKAPKSWISKAANSIRVGSYTVPGQYGNADLSVVALGGHGGGLVANINRWRNQLGLGPQTKQEILQAKKRGKGKLGAFDWFWIQGKKDQSFLAAIFSQKEGMTIFVKMVGPKKTIRQQKDAFITFCRTMYVD